MSWDILQTTIPTRETQAINTDFCPIGVFIQKTQSNNVHNCSEPANAQVLGDMKDAEKRIISTAISKESTQPENECEVNSIALYALYNHLAYCLERFPLPLGAWDGLRYFIVALPEPSI